MADLNYTHTLVAGENEDVGDVQDNFNDVKTFLEGGNLDSDNIGSIGAGNIPAGLVTADHLADAAKLGISGASTVRRGKCIIPGLESRANTAYGLMTTPDRVQNIVLPTDGLIAVLYKATWRESTNAAANAAIFIGANQLKMAAPTAPSVMQTALASGISNTWNALHTYPGGLNSTASTTSYGSDITTGEIVGGIQPIGSPGGGSMQVPFGGPCYVFAAAGTYDVSVQFKASSGQVDVTERKLWVWTMGF